MANAPWPAPPRTGVTLWHVTDTHISTTPGKPWSYDHVVESAAEVEQFMDLWNVAGRLHTGDITDHGADTARNDDALALPWVNSTFKTASDMILPGNHDYRGVDSSVDPNRTRYDWENVYGRSALAVSEMVSNGQKIRVLGISADTQLRQQGTDDVWTMTQATIDWLSAQLSAHPEPTWIACHYMLQEHGSYGAGQKAQPESQLVSLISSFPNVIGWLSGHAHWNFGTQSNIKSLSVGNRTSFPSISGPSTGQSNTIDAANVPGPNTSMLITFVDFTRIEVRFRDHGAKLWIPYGDGKTVKSLVSK